MCFGSITFTLLFFLDLWRVIMSALGAPPPLLAVFLQEPYCGRFSDYSIVAVGCRQDRLQKWYLPPQLHAHLVELVSDADPLFPPLAWRGPGTVVGIAIVKPFVCLHPPSELVTTLRIHIRDYWFRVRHTPLAELLWGKVVAVYRFAVPLTASMDKAFNTLPVCDCHQQLGSTSRELLDTPVAFIPATPWGGLALSAVLDGLCIHWPGLKPTFRQKGFDCFLACKWLCRCWVLC